NNFFRILDVTTRVPISPEQKEAIVKTHGTSDGTQINYLDFLKTVEPRFDPNVFAPQELEFGANQEQYTNNLMPLLQKIKEFTNYRGIRVKECYEQFDSTKIGCITKSQFYRFFPGPPSVTKEEIDTLANIYSSSTRPGLIDYNRLEVDLANCDAWMNKKDLVNTNNSNNCVEEYGDQRIPSTHDLINKLKYAVLKHGLRTKDFFRQYDPLSHDSISPCKFASALTSAFEKAQTLTEQEVAALINIHKRPDGLVSYKAFCEQLDAPFMALHLDKDPLTPSVPAKEQDFERVITTILTESEIQRLRPILQLIADQ
ncbi:hypothetical protein Ciccas_014635, partial [Cichlidogyrus casuarinus]